MFFLAAAAFSSSFALLWSAIIICAKRLTSAFWAFVDASLPNSTSVIPPTAASVQKLSLPAFEFASVLFEFMVAIVFDGTGVLGRDVLSGPEFEVDWSARLQLTEKIVASATTQQIAMVFI